MSSWHSYPKIYNVGHAAAKELFFDDVVIEEKVDGSQFSFGMIDGQLKVRSKGVEMDPEHPEKMFSKAVETVKSIADRLIDGWTYSGEYLQKPKHNTLAYDRTPKGNIAIFDVRRAEEDYATRSEKEVIANALGLEVVPVLYCGPGSQVDADTIAEMMRRVSFLGGQAIEGVVIKNYHRFGPDKKALMGKHVSEEFKEKHGTSWAEANPGQGDVIQKIIDTYRTPARFDKAIIHLKEKGLLTGTPKDIGALIAEVKEDLMLECGDEIKALLWQLHERKILSGVSSGMPQYYKEKLLKEQFQQ